MKAKKCPIAKKVKAHLKEDMHESRESIKEDKTLLKKLPKKVKASVKKK